MISDKVLIGKKIRSLRKQSGFTQEQFSEKIGIEPAPLSNIENGKNYPNNDTLEKLSDALSLRPYELYMFDYYRSKDELINEMIQAMQTNEKLTQNMYKYFICIR